MDKIIVQKLIMAKINLNEITMAKIKMFKIIMAKPTVTKFNNNFKLIVGLLIMVRFIRVK